MKFIGKLLLYILITLLVAITGLYFLLQTHWGAEHISTWVSKNSNYHLAFRAMDHHFSTPSHIMLENITFGHDGQPTTLVAKSVNIALSSQQLTKPHHVNTILLENRTLNLTNQTTPLPFKANHLQLHDMAFNSPNSKWKLSTQQVNGSIVPWSPKASKVLGTKAQIQFSARSLSLNDVPATNVLIEGSIDNNHVTLTNLGANITHRTLTRNTQHNTNSSWQVENLRMADIHLQSKKSLTNFFAPLHSVPSLQIGRLEVINAHLQGPDWAVTNLNLSLHNMTFSKDDWQTQEGKLSMNTSKFIYGSLHLFDPIINTEFSPQGIALRQFTSHWEGGMVRTSGNWLHDRKTLILDDAAIARLEYTLPKNWQQLWMETTPSWLNSLQLKRFSTSHNLIIDINPDFPWQLTTLNGYSANLTLVTNHKWGIWSGSANLNATTTTFNHVDVHRPSLALTTNSSTVNISKLSAFTEKGILEATTSVSQTPQHQTHISLNGHSVPVNILQQWGWPELPLTGNSNIQLTTSGNIQANVPLKPTVSRQLHAMNTTKQQVTQTMNAGIISSSEVTSTEPVQ